MAALHRGPGRGGGHLGAVVVAGSARLEPDSGDQCLLSPSVTVPAPALPAGARVRTAELVWAMSGPADDRVEVDGIEVVADSTTTVELSGGVASSGRADLRGRVSLAGPLVVTDLQADAGPERCTAMAVLTGVALVVVYEHPDLPLRTVVVDHGLDRVGDDVPVGVRTIDGRAVPRVAGTTTVQVLVWEGDAFGADEHLRVGGEELPGGVVSGTLWDGRSGDAAPAWGVEVDGGVLATPPVGRAPVVVEVTSGADQVLVGEIVLVIDDGGHDPVATDDAALLSEDTHAEVDVVANDRHPDGADDRDALDDVTVTITAWPEVVRARVEGHRVVLDAPPGFTGTDRVGYALCDPLGRCGHGTLAVTAQLDEPPDPVVVRAAAGTPVPVEAALLDSGLDTDRLELVTPPGRGGVTVDRDGGRLVYTWPEGAAAPDTFSYRACLERGPCHIRAVTVEPLA